MQELGDGALQEMSKALLVHVYSVPSDSVKEQQIREMNGVALHKP